MDKGYELFKKERAADKSIYRSGDSPFFLSHNSKTGTAFLLIHGFAASPWEMKDMGEFLYKKGFNVHGVRLAGHATTPEDLLHIKWQDWYRSVTEGFDLISHSGENIIVIGMSTGALLALHLASNVKKVRAIIPIAPALFYQDYRVRFTPILKYFIKYNPRPLTGIFKDHYYEDRAVNGISEVFKLSKVVRDDLSKISQPLYIIHSKSDPVIRVDSSEYIFINALSEKKEIFLLDDAPHVLITSENPRQLEVFDRIGIWADKLNLSH